MRVPFVVAVLVPLTLTAAATTARAAEDEAALARITEINRTALRLIEQSDFAGARKALKEALELCDAEGLQQHPIKARTHVHLGAVLVMGFDQRELGMKQFAKAREIQPEIRLTPEISSLEVEDAFTASSAPVAQRTQPTKEVDPPTSAGKERADDDEDAADDDDERDGASDGRKLFLALSVGSGVGWAGGNADLNANARVENAGFALAQLGHVVPEVGYWLRPALRLSVEGRIQRVIGTTDIMDNGRTFHAANYAAAGFAKATWLFGGTGKLQPFVSAALGAGRIRHVVTFTARKTCGASGTETCVDTVGAGPLLAGGGAGLTYDLGHNLALLMALNTQLAAPRFTFNIDGNVGLALRL